MARKTLLAALLALAAVAAEAGDFGSRVDSLLGKGAMDRSTTAVMVYDLTEGKEIYSHNAGKLLRPASIRP